MRAGKLSIVWVAFSPRDIGNPGSIGDAAPPPTRDSTSRVHRAPHMFHNHITTLHYLIINTTFTQLKQYKHLNIAKTPIGTIMLWKNTLN
ncbi:unnamed protein product [Pieris brassicae]|uniref:Uncharacterized protein n=1 Tax=Pieris brassicae TaxID=7116 RepID=A0A9P0XHZ4_PIEBR|nr:unnamed protein product [Pieris brassicae]